MCREEVSGRLFRGKEMDVELGESKSEQLQMVCNAISELRKGQAALEEKVDCLHRLFLQFSHGSAAAISREENLLQVPESSHEVNAGSLVAKTP